MNSMDYIVLAVLIGVIFFSTPLLLTGYRKRDKQYVAEQIDAIREIVKPKTVLRDARGFISFTGAVFDDIEVPPDLGPPVMLDEDLIQKLSTLSIRGVLVGNSKADPDMKQLIANRRYLTAFAALHDFKIPEHLAFFDGVTKYRYLCLLETLKAYPVARIKHSDVLLVPASNPEHTELLTDRPTARHLARRVGIYQHYFYPLEGFIVNTILQQRGLVMPLWPVFEEQLRKNWHRQLPLNLTGISREELRSVVTAVAAVYQLPLPFSYIQYDPLTAILINAVTPEKPFLTMVKTND